MDSGTRYSSHNGLPGLTQAMKKLLPSPSSLQFLRPCPVQHQHHAVAYQPSLSRSVRYCLPVPQEANNILQAMLQKNIID